MKTQNLDIDPEVRQSFLDEGITDLNPPQEKAVSAGVLEGEDMVVASPTASGKTLVAELALTKNTVEGDGMTVYVVPLKALASEKYEDFSERYTNLDVRMAVGDYDSGGENMDAADVLIATSEKLDSLLRHSPSWISRIDLVVVDEIHLLNSPNRGPTLEVTITKLRDTLNFQLPWSLRHHIERLRDGGLARRGTCRERLPPGGTGTGCGARRGLGVLRPGRALPEQRRRDSSFSKASDHEEGIEPEREVELAGQSRETPVRIVEDTLDREKQAIVFTSSRKGAEKSSDRNADVVEDSLSEQEKEELDGYADRILSALGSPTSQCRRLAENLRRGAAFHHAGLVTSQRQVVEEAFRKGLVKTVSATPTLAAGVNLPAFRVVIRDLKRYTGSGMDFIPVLEYEQMTGRAGRPGFDDRGEAISVAKNPGMTGEIVDRYIAGEPEKIRSKLAAEPVLRMHTLSLVASKYTRSREELLEFFEGTFYAHQFGDFSEIERKLSSTIEELREYGFIDPNEFEATDTGERVAELYIDPDSANLMLESLRTADRSDETRPISYLFMLARTSEMAPRPNLKSGEGTEIERALQDARSYLLESVPQEWDPSYDLYLECMKLALMLRAWISEVDEERIMEKYGVAPGGVRAKNRNADWLLYSAQELCRLEGIEQREELERLRRRMRHGIKEELLPLVKFDQIGRVRARTLMEHGIDTQQRIRGVQFEKLKKLIGDSTARTLKEQVGEENIFDRENIMDYFDE
nr:MAG: superfamily II helicase [Candidatus Nanosalinarum sp. J07AB56]